MSEFNKYRLKGAYHYDWYKTEDWYKYLVDRCVKFCKGSTIDIGCGDGLLANLIASKGYKVIGVDKDPEGIKLAAERSIGDISWIETDICKNWGGGKIKTEYLTCLNAIEHLNKPEKLLDILRDDVKKGAIITTIDYQGGAFGEDHKFEWTYDEMMEFFKEFKPKGFRYKDTEWIGVEIQK